MPVTACKEFSTECFQDSESTFSFATKILNVNVQSLCSNFETLEAFAASVARPFDLMCLSETFLYDNVVRNYALNGYYCICKQRSTRGGGVGVYVGDGAADCVECCDVTSFWT